MSHAPFDRSPDLARLIEDGYEVAVAGGSLLIRSVPYVAPDGMVDLGTVVVPLELAGDATVRPTRHVSGFVGRRPCDAGGRPLPGLVPSGPSRPGEPPARWRLCIWPGREYLNFHEFAVSHVGHYEAQAALVSPGASARSRPYTQGPVDFGLFAYADTATARDGIERHAMRLTGHRVGIVGLGGTGSYVLDLVAKTPVAAIHIFDDDVFLQHNAFRSPGAPGADEFAADLTKVGRFSAIYSRMHPGVVAHSVRLDGANSALLEGLDFVFLCVDDPPAKVPILAGLDRRRIPFVDCGIGLCETPVGLAGLVRVTIGAGGSGAPLAAEGMVPVEDTGNGDPYSFRAQVADANALNAALAVMAWKRFCGFYAGNAAGQTIYSIDTGTVATASTGGSGNAAT